MPLLKQFLQILAKTLRLYGKEKFEADCFKFIAADCSGKFSLSPD